jgi:DNA modification methylase
VKPYYDDGQCAIYHGDCRPMLDTLDVQAIVTDPPYGIALKNHGMIGSKEWDRIEGDEDGAAAYDVIEWALQHAMPTIAFASPWKPWPGYWPNLLVWDKCGGVGGGGDTATTAKRTWELIQCRRVECIGGGRPESVWRHPLGQHMLAFHPTQKPEALMVDLLRTFIRPEYVVLDPFMGSGSTLVAAKRLGRSAVGIEINERYCEAAARRLSQGSLFSVSGEIQEASCE